MRFSEWSEKVKKQQYRLKDIALSDVSESISVNGKTITVTIGKDKCEALINGTSYWLKELRSLYTNHKEEFDAVLESITQSTEQVATATEIILATISDEAVPQAVLARMKGEQVSGEPADLIEEMTKKKLQNLYESISELLPLSRFTSFEAELPPIANGDLLLEIMQNEVYKIGWGNIVIGRRSTISISNMQEAMYFVANFDLIKEAFLQFVRKVKAID